MTGLAGVASDIAAWIAANPSLTLAFAFLIAASESLVVVGALIPGTPILMAIGAAASLGHVSLTGVVVAATLGAIIGDGLSYWLGHRYRDRLLASWPLASHPVLLARGVAFFRRWGALGIALARFLPGVRAVVPVVAGMFRMPPLAANRAVSGHPAIRGEVPLHPSRDAVYSAPPGRFRACTANALGSHLGVDDEALLRIWVLDPGGRQPPRRNWRHPCPGDVALLAAAPERPLPVPGGVVHRGRDRPRSGEHRVIRNLAAHHPAEPATLLGDQKATQPMRRVSRTPEQVRFRFPLLLHSVFPRTLSAVVPTAWKRLSGQSSCTWVDGARPERTARISLRTPETLWTLRVGRFSPQA